MSLNQSKSWTSLYACVRLVFYISMMAWNGIDKHLLTKKGSFLYFSKHNQMERACDMVEFCLQCHSHTARNRRFLIRDLTYLCYFTMC